MKKELEHIFRALLGILLFAMAYAWFLVPGGLYSGGFTGISQILKYLLTDLWGLAVPEGVDLTGVISWMVNIPLFVLGFRSIGKHFLYYSLICVTVQSILLSLIPPFPEPILRDATLNAAVGGALSGFGVGLTLRAGGSGGGLDIVGMYTAKKYPDFSVGKVSIIINTAVYLFAAVRNDVNIAAYSLLYSLISGLVTDRAHYQNIRVSAMVVSRKKELGGIINREINRGVTTWRGYGEYSHDEEYVFMVVTNKFEWRQLRRLLLQEDPGAFVQVIMPEQVIGNFEKRLEIS